MKAGYDKLFIFFTLLYVLFFTKTWGAVSGNIYSHDDVVYYAQTASLVNDRDIDIGNNLGPYSGIYLEKSPVTGRIMPYQPLGPSLLYLAPYVLTKPFVHLISLIRGAVFDQYDPLFFVVICFFTFILFYISGQFIRKTLGFFFGQPIADIAAVFTLWGTILPVYVFRRPVFGVIPELFAASSLLFCFAKIYQRGSVSRAQSALFGALAGFLVITRWNDVYLIPLCLILLFGLASKERNLRKGVVLFVFFILFSGIFFALQALAWIRIYGQLKYFFSYYYLLHKQYICSYNTVWIYLKNLAHVFLGFDWGVAFTMPVLFFGGAAFLVSPKFKLLKYRALDSAFFLFTFWACLHVVLQWKNTGEFYGYRFLISLLPFGAIGFASFVGKLRLRYQKMAAALVLAYCLLNFLVILPFEFTDKTTLIPDTITPLGGHGWGNNAYFINALKFYFEAGFKNLVAVFSRGYLGAFIFGSLSLCGMDLAKFGPKVAGYFSMAGYKNYAVFTYPVFIACFFYFACKRTAKNERNE